MADITFLLIIFFMVSTVFDVSRGIQMRLPATTTQQDIKERNVTISIDATQALFLDGERAELRGLGRAVLGKLAGEARGLRPDQERPGGALPARGRRPRRAAPGRDQQHRPPDGEGRQVARPQHLQPMSRINPEGQITRKERLVTVIAIIGAVLVHLVVVFGWGRIYRWTQEEQKKERLMVIRRVRDVAPPRETIPAPPRQRPGPAGTEGAVGGGEKAARPPRPTRRSRRRAPNRRRRPELSPAMEQELQEQQPDADGPAEHGDNSVSVVTDLPGGLVHRRRAGRVPGLGHLLGPQGGAAGDLHGHVQPRGGVRDAAGADQGAGREGADRLRRQVPAQHRAGRRQQRARRPGHHLPPRRPSARVEPPGPRAPRRPPARDLHGGLQGRRRATSRRRRSRARSLPAASSRSSASTRTASGGRGSGAAREARPGAGRAGAAPAAARAAAAGPGAAAAARRREASGEDGFRSRRMAGSTGACRWSSRAIPAPGSTRTTTRSPTPR